MAASFAARIVGYFKPPPKHAPTDKEVEAAFEGFKYKHFHEVALTLSSRNRDDAEEAVQETLLDLFEKRPDLYRESPKGWLGLLYSASRFRLFDIRSSSPRTESIEELADSEGDAAFKGARPCVPLSLDAADPDRYAPPPKKGERWTRTQVIAALQRFRDFYGRPPKAKECKAVHMLPSYVTIRCHFGDLGSAILAAGMVPSTLGQRRKRWDAVEAAKACLSFRRRNGYWPGGAEARRSSGELPGESVMFRFFGGARPADVQVGAEAILAGIDGGGGPAR